VITQPSNKGFNELKTQFNQALSWKKVTFFSQGQREWATSISLWRHDFWHPRHEQVSEPCGRQYASSHASSFSLKRRETTTNITRCNIRRPSCWGPNHLKNRPTGWPGHPKRRHQKCQRRRRYWSCRREFKHAGVYPSDIQNCAHQATFACEKYLEHHPDPEPHLYALTCIRTRARLWEYKGCFFAYFPLASTPHHERYCHIDSDNGRVLYNMLIQLRDGTLPMLWKYEESKINLRNGRGSHFYHVPL